jgi:hypothetical protein
MFGLYGPPTFTLKPQPTPAKYPVRGCLQASLDQTFCGDPLMRDDFRFVDVEHAMKHYENGKFLKVCEACVRTFKLLRSVE